MKGPVRGPIAPPFGPRQLADDLNDEYHMAIVLGHDHVSVSFEFADRLIEALRHAPKATGSGKGREPLTRQQRYRRSGLIAYAKNLHSELKARKVPAAAEQASEAASHFGREKLGLNLAASTILRELTRKSR